MTRCSVLAAGDLCSSWLKQKNALFFMIGPPCATPWLYCLSRSFGALPVAGSGGKSRLRNHVFAFSPSWRRYSYAVPVQLFVPILVTNFTCTLPCPVASAVLPAVVTVT